MSEALLDLSWRATFKLEDVVAFQSTRFISGRASLASCTEDVSDPGEE
jgi:hypothetical protein